MSDYNVGEQPSACPGCGFEAPLSQLKRHLQCSHTLGRLGRSRVYNVAWREVQIALLGITTPQWDGP